MELKSEDKLDFLNIHLPYRINTLLSPDLLEYRRSLNEYSDIKVRCYEDNLVLDPSFEASIIFGRQLLNFIGITYDIKNKKLSQITKYKDDDLKLTDLYPNNNFCHLNDEIIVQNEKVYVQLLN